MNNFPLMLKDLGLAAEASIASGSAIPLGELARTFTQCMR
jgi:hypothetical protein